MRTISELLQIMLTHQALFKNGLCEWSDDIYDQGIINYKEYLCLRNYIYKNKPELLIIAGVTYEMLFSLWWPAGNIKPRLTWLNEHIELTKYQQQ